MLAARAKIVWIDACVLILVGVSVSRGEGDLDLPYSDSLSQHNGTAFQIESVYSPMLTPDPIGELPPLFRKNLRCAIVGQYSYWSYIFDPVTRRATMIDHNNVGKLGGPEFGVAGISETQSAYAVRAEHMDENGTALYAKGGPQGYAAEFEGRVSIQSDGVLLRGVNQSGKVVVEIGEGFDYAETFACTSEGITSGTVMVIDSANVGSLSVSTQAYDRKVAGVVAGAKGIRSGVRLGSLSKDQGGQSIALAGRIYCNVDTRYGDIQVGDLLTTSPTPGHAMVVGDFTKAPGAILGKAMEGLSGGKGQILVLVTLQ